MQYIFVNPPNYILSLAPITGIPGLLGELKNRNIEAEYIDLNIDFGNKLIKDRFIFRYFNLLNKLLNDNGNKNNSDFIQELITNNIDSLQKYKKIIKVYNQIGDFIYKILNSEKFFYNPLLLSIALKNLSLFINMAGELIDIHITKKIIQDVESYRTNSKNMNFTVDIKFLLAYFDSEYCILKDYYDSIIDSILSQNPKCIGITTGVYSQFVPAMLLCFLLKKKTDIHINIGGSFMNDFYKYIDNLKDFFGLFCDSISVGNSTQTVYQLIEYLDSKRPIEEVDNLIYLKNNETISNDKDKRNTKISQFDFDGYKYIKDYPISKLILPVQASTGCYWGKCIFCDCTNPKENYILKPPENIVNELEYLSKRYKTKYFYFWDNALHPKYLDKMADLIIEKKLKISYSVFCRFEKEFDDKLFKKLRKSGCLQIFWGLDSGSDKVLKYIRKGITISEVEKILPKANKANILNSVYIILGHPTETLEDMQNSYEFCKKNKKYVFLYIVTHEVYFLADTTLQSKREYYKSKILTTKEEKEDLAQKIENLNKTPFKILIFIFFLYVDKYGILGTKIRFYIYNFIWKNKFLSQIYMKRIYSLINKI